MIMNEASLEELEAVKAQLKSLMPRLSKHKLEEIQKLVSKYYMKAWKHRKIPKSVNGNIVLTSKYARHREIGSTQVYVYTAKEELYDAIEVAFSKNHVKESVLYEK